MALPAHIATAVVIASSGYSTDPAMAESERYGFDAVVAKPYGIEALDKALRKIVAGEPEQVRVR